VSLQGQQVQLLSRHSSYVVKYKVGNCSYVGTVSEGFKLHLVTLHCGLKYTIWILHP